MARENNTIQRPSNAEIANVMARFGVTAKQAGYALATIANPHASTEERASVAGYAPMVNTAKGGGVIKSSSIIDTVKALTEEQAEIQRKAREFNGAIKTNARDAIQNKLTEHAESPNVTPNQTRAVELIGKMNGVFIERLEIDAGEHTRARYAQELEGNFAEVSEE